MDSYMIVLMSVICQKWYKCLQKYVDKCFLGRNNDIFVIAREVINKSAASEWHTGVFLFVICSRNMHCFQNATVCWHGKINFL